MAKLELLEGIDIPDDAKIEEVALMVKYTSESSDISHNIKDRPGHWEKIKNAAFVFKKFTLKED